MWGFPIKSTDKSRDVITVPNITFWTFNYGTSWVFNFNPKRRLSSYLNQFYIEWARNRLFSVGLHVCISDFAWISRDRNPLISTGIIISVTAIWNDVWEWDPMIHTGVRILLWIGMSDEIMPIAIRRKLKVVMYDSYSCALHWLSCEGNNCIIYLKILNLVTVIYMM